MSIISEVIASQRRVNIKISGRFDFSLHKKFRNTFREIEVTSYRVTIDLKGAEYMDSSALGMLLILRDKLGGDDAKITIVNCRPEILKIFNISNMDKMFDLI